MINFLILFYTVSNMFYTVYFLVVQILIIILGLDVFLRTHGADMLLVYGIEGEMDLHSALLHSISINQSVNQSRL